MRKLTGIHEVVVLLPSIYFESVGVLSASSVGVLR